MSSPPGEGVAGRVARRFLNTEITPLLALVGLLLGVFAVVVTPREEEPQINVTFANIFIAYPGASAAEVESLVSTPAEQVLSEIKGVKHVYSVSRPGMAVLTVQYFVGEDRVAAIVGLYNAIYSKSDWLPANLGVMQPIIKPKGIDDVPIVTLTLWSKESSYGGAELLEVAHAIEVELKRVEGTRDVYTIGGSQDVVHLKLKPERLAGYGLALDDLRKALQVSNSAHPAGALVADNREILVQTGAFLSSVEDIGELVVGAINGAPIYLHDVAEIEHSAEQPDNYVWHGIGAASEEGVVAGSQFPAVTVAIAKKPGSNAVAIAERVIERFAQLEGIIIPDGVEVSVTRNYGATANDKAKKLISKLIFATASVVALVLLTLGYREAFIVGMAVVITLSITLFASYAWGFTLNRVSLFALIFSIGILVDDAIVVVENIHRQIQLGNTNLLEAIPLAVDEVGGPTILATLTVIAALLPMAFVSGLMGPYMSPIPINASIGMLISLAVAFVITPWMFRAVVKVDTGHAGVAHVGGSERLQRLFQQLLGPFLRAAQGAPKRRLLAVAIVVLILLSVSLVGVKLVVLKMLPFDNKSEFQVVVDMPEGSTLEQTARVLSELGEYLVGVPEVRDYQVYAGLASPINFNGLVRQYYLRQGANVGDIQVNLVGKGQRERQSHEIAMALRQPLQAIGEPYGASVKMVEVPPGPPVHSPLVAEVHGLDYPGQIEAARALSAQFASVDDIVDVDISAESLAPKLMVRVDQGKAALLGVDQHRVVKALSTLLSGEDVSYLHSAHYKYPRPIRLELAAEDKADIETLLKLRLRSRNGVLIPLSEIVTVEQGVRENAIYHKDLQRVVYVTGDMGGELDSPLYGLYAISSRLQESALDGGLDLQQSFINSPQNPYEYSVKWGGEWEVTYQTFRDMGIAYSIGLLLIYLLVVAQFRSYLIPLVIMAPIPLTIIGVMPGHFIADKQFTATSMIGMIALAGIIVRNSILLVDFINQQLREGVDFEHAVVNAGAVRAKPIVLTGAAAMVGAFFILDDPIFSGLAVSLISGILVSTLLTLVVIPVMYYAFFYRRYSEPHKGA